MKKKVPYLHDVETSSKMPHRWSSYRQVKDKDVDLSGHSFYKKTGLSQYIEDMERAEKNGKFRLDTRKL